MVRRRALSGRGERSLSRRRLLVAAGAATAGLSGCLGLGGGPSASGDAVSELPPPVRGDPEADVTVMAFEDYACPHCAHYVLNILPDVVSNYAEPGKIRYEHHDFPIPVDGVESWRAGSAARAVQDTVGMDAFWEYSHKLYANQRNLGLDLYEQLAREVGAEDPGAIRAAAEANRYKPVLEADRQKGSDMGVGGTPTVFVNGRAVDPAADGQSGLGYGDIEAAIENAL
ncbi:DsbA family protein [Halobacteriaceae archaeon GCM10025711]